MNSNYTYFNIDTGNFADSGVNLNLEGMRIDGQKKKPFEKESALNSLSKLKEFTQVGLRFGANASIYTGKQQVEYNFDTQMNECLQTIQKIAFVIWDQYQREYAKKKGLKGLIWDWIKGWFVSTEIRHVQAMYEEVMESTRFEFSLNLILREERFLRQKIKNLEGQNEPNIS